MGAGSGLSGKERYDSLAILIMTMVLGLGIDVLYMRNGNFIPDSGSMSHKVEFIDI